MKGFVKNLVPVLALLYHYQALLNNLVFNLALTHRTFCKLLSILLALFSDLVSKVNYRQNATDNYVHLCSCNSRVFVFLLKLNKWKEKEEQTLNHVKEVALMKE